MSKKLVPHVLSLLLIVFPFRWAYLENINPFFQVISMVVCILGFFTVVLLYDRAAAKTSH